MCQGLWEKPLGLAAKPVVWSTKQVCKNDKEKTCRLADLRISSEKRHDYTGHARNY